VSGFDSYGHAIPGVALDDLSGWLIVVEGTDGVGRTTHITRLRAHLEKLGYAVAETGLSRSDLASRGIHRAKLGNTLGSNAFNLFYATDFADRLQQQIVPALRSGFVMITDRYVYSLIARAIVRGADPDWIKKVYAFALRPDAVFYLRIDVKTLVPRVLADGPFDYWESGMDLPMGEDLYDSFIQYQQRLIAELDGLASEYSFQTIDATRSVADISEDLCERVTQLLNRPRPAPSLRPA
jgi:dTMP kinase